MRARLGGGEEGQGWGGGGGEWRGSRGEGSQINLEMVGRMEALGSVSGEWRNVRRS